MLKLISLGERLGRVCFYCGANKSVKYHDPTRHIYVCNRCAATEYSNKKESKK